MVGKLGLLNFRTVRRAARLVIDPSYVITDELPAPHSANGFILGPGTTGQLVIGTWFHSILEGDPFPYGWDVLPN